MFMLILLPFPGGLSKKEQDLTIEQFKNGDLNIIVATDAGREGIDIKECNAVVNYSHKTNVIGMTSLILL